ncbi:MAG: Na/Pi cotransporter [Bacteroidetes bacterium HGW-Bacteroidetes-11]|jgi:phosphate:Na+ symporter|nr:MAG: Na/Pi cotransporter [Bacteroidetes bacterium HGW-Bacteroidetes-11]
MVSFSSIINILTILGSLMLFLFGMKLMSESLQRISGNRLRNIFSSIASNRLKAITAGVVVTGVIQSSSAVTVMLVSFVNAGLLSLSQAIGIMMGANMGTTVTAWLITLFGFKFEFTTILLPVLGLALPFLFLPGARNKSLGEFLIGFSILFLGLQFMKNSLPGIDENSPIVAFITSISSQGTGSYLLFAAAGFLITLLIQSSSATIALTFVMCHNGYIGYDAAAAMILGENLGTTVTANIAAIVANRSAKRLAFSHTLFNLTGIIWALLFFRFLVGISYNLADYITGNSPIESEAIVPLGLSIFHTGFNVLNTLILVWFIPSIKHLLEIIIPLRPNEKKSFKLRYFKSRFMAINEVDILQAHEQISYFGRHVAYMFNLIPEYLIEKREQKSEKIQKRLYKSEEQADELDREITDYITRIAENDLSEANSRKVRAMLKITDDLESIADQCLQMERTIRRKNEASAWFTQEMRDDLFELFNLVKESLNTMNENLAGDYRPGILAKATEHELKVNELRDKLIQSNKLRLEAGEYQYKHASFYAELLNQCEKLADHVINVNQAIASNIK